MQTSYPPQGSPSSSWILRRPRLITATEQQVEGNATQNTQSVVQQPVAPASTSSAPTSAPTQHDTAPPTTATPVPAEENGSSPTAHTQNNEHNKDDGEESCVGEEQSPAIQTSGRWKKRGMKYGLDGLLPRNKTEASLISELHKLDRRMSMTDLSAGAEDDLGEEVHEEKKRKDKSSPSGSLIKKKNKDAENKEGRGENEKQTKERGGSFMSKLKRKSSMLVVPSSDSVNNHNSHESTSQATEPAGNESNVPADSPPQRARNSTRSNAASTGSTPSSNADKTKKSWAGMKFASLSKLRDTDSTCYLFIYSFICFLFLFMRN